MVKLINVTTMEQAITYADSLRLRSNIYPNEIAYVSKVGTEWFMAYDVHELMRAGKQKALSEIVVQELPVAIEVI